MAETKINKINYPEQYKQSTTVNVLSLDAIEKHWANIAKSIKDTDGSPKSIIELFKQIQTVIFIIITLLQIEVKVKFIK